MTYSETKTVRQLCNNRTDGLDCSLQFFYIPPPFMGIKEVNLSFWEEIDYLLAEKQAVPIFPTNDRQERFTLQTSWFLYPLRISVVGSRVYAVTGRSFIGLQP